MKNSLKIKISAAVVLCSLWTVPTYAARVDFLSGGAATETFLFGAPVGSYSDTTTVCTGCAPAFVISIDARAYLSGGTIGAGAGVYTYVYEISHTLPPPDTLDILSVSTSGFPGTAALNGPSGFNYGVADALPTDFLKLLLATSNGNISFFMETFTSAGLLAPSGGALTIYAQSDLPPGLVPFFGQDGGQASGALTLAPVPEPSYFAIIGLAGLGVVAIQRRRRSTAN